jgi:uncharacterized protein YndB with AHSA1/START domain
MEWNPDLQNAGFCFIVFFCRKHPCSKSFFASFQSSFPPYVCNVNRTNINNQNNNMETATKTAITVEATVNAPVEKVWSFWNGPHHITKWAQPSDDWHAPFAANDLRTDGTFKTTMAAKDGSFSFDFEGVYTNVQLHKLIEYTIADGRKVKIAFSLNGKETKITETFETEDINPVEMQRGGWQAILDSFKKYTETH